jgi:hypothetical protein
MSGYFNIVILILISSFTQFLGIIVHGLVNILAIYLVHSTVKESDNKILLRLCFIVVNVVSVIILNPVGLIVITMWIVNIIVIANDAPAVVAQTTPMASVNDDISASEDDGSYLVSTSASTIGSGKEDEDHSSSSVAKFVYDHIPVLAPQSESRCQKKRNRLRPLRAFKTISSSNINNSMIQFDPKLHPEPPKDIALVNVAHEIAGMTYHHWAVYIGCGVVIEYTKDDDPHLTNLICKCLKMPFFAGGLQALAIIKAGTWKNFITGAKRYGVIGVPDPEKTIVRAILNIKRKKYNVALENCETFARWCAPGKRQCSHQTNGIITWVKQLKAVMFLHKYCDFRTRRNWTNTKSQLWLTLAQDLIHERNDLSKQSVVLAHLANPSGIELKHSKITN